MVTVTKSAVARNEGIHIIIMPIVGLIFVVAELPGDVGGIAHGYIRSNNHNSSGVMARLCRKVGLCFPLVNSNRFKPLYQIVAHRALDQTLQHSPLPSALDPSYVFSLQQLISGHLKSN
jgi:hypothetical protein